MKRTLRIALLIAAVLAIAVLAGCSSASSGGGSTSTPPASSSGSSSSSSGGAASGPAVSIANFAFSPATVTVKVGDTVTWTNNDSVPHTVTADDGTFASDTLAQGQTFSFKFAKAGSVSYHCSIHPQMTAQVTVQ